MAITAVLPTTLAFPHRGELIQDAFVAAQEASQDVLAGSWTTQANLFATEANALESNVNAKEASANLAAIASVGASNFQGTWKVGTSYAMGQSVAYNSISYTALRITVGDAPDISPLDWVSLTINDPALNAQREPLSGAVYIGSYTTANRPTIGVNDRVIGYNLTLSSYEGWNGTIWSSVGGGGATGGGSDKVFQENDQVVTTNYTLTAGKNAMSAGPVTFNNGISVTVPNGATYTII